MAKYIKANRLVAQHLGLQDVRVHTQDDCYILWQADMLSFGPLTDLQSTAEQIGALVLTPQEARTEQDGTTLRELPTATDERFIEPEVTEPEVEGPEEVQSPEVVPEEAEETTESEYIEPTVAEQSSEEPEPEVEPVEPTTEEPEAEATAESEAADE